MAIIEAVEAGDSKESDRFEEILSYCLLCGGCAKQCAAGVNVCSRIQETRARLVENKGLSLGKRIFLDYLLGSGVAGRKVLKGCASLQGLLSRAIPEDSGFHLRFPASLCTGRNWIPPLADQFFLEKDFDEPGSGSVAYFSGCITNYCFPHIGEAVLRTLHILGEKAFIPRNQKCCGFPAYAAGDNAAARELAGENVQAFSRGNFEFLVTSCASCGSHIRSHYPELLRDDKELAGQASELAGKVVDVSTLLFRNQSTIMAGLGHSQNTALKVVYHNPCHLRIGQEITSEPRRLLACLPGVQVLDYKDELECCGYGGLFNVSHFNLSHDILFKRISCLKELAPDALITSCMGCILHWKEGMVRNRVGIRVMHLVELIDLSLNGLDCRDGKISDIGCR